MNHIQFPFDNEGVLTFRNLSSDDQCYQLNTEIAKSKIEIFQSWCYRVESNPYNSLDSLTLLFPDPFRQYYVKTEYNFDVTVMTVNTKGIINNI